MTDTDLDTCLLLLLADDLRVDLRSATTLPPPPCVTTDDARVLARLRAGQVPS